MQQPRKIIKSGVISNLEIHMIYGKMDVVRPEPERKRSSKISFFLKDKSIVSRRKQFLNILSYRLSIF